MTETELTVRIILVGAPLIILIGWAYASYKANKWNNSHKTF